ncbi:hypothetical protein ABT112_02145 [Streptomyces sp. NPDC002055]|uniref:hypothetical protein n=1 Tax=Streptomyces sp. NPDC002055 TaxID=3154534 RepID=UPI0033223977
MAGAGDIEASIDEWVRTQLDASPAWSREKWEMLGSLLDVEFSMPGEQPHVFKFPATGSATDSEAA